MTRRRTTLAGGTALLALVAAASWSYQTTGPLLVAARVHEAFSAADDAGVITLSARLVDTPDHDGEVLAALAERCVALTRSGDEAGCMSLLDRRLFGGDALTWVPQESLPKWFDYAIAQGRRADAAAVAERWRAREPADPVAANWAYYTRLGEEDAKALFRDAGGWATGLPPTDALRLRLRVASEMIDQHLGGDALLVLTAVPPQTSATDLAQIWWLTRISAACDSGDQPLCRGVRDDWIAAGGHAPTARAAYAVALSRASLLDPEFGGWIPALTASFDELSEITLPSLRRGVIVRLLGHLAVDEEREKLAKYLDLAKNVQPDVVQNEDELRRLLDAQAQSEGDKPAVRFIADHPVGTASLWVAPDATERPDGKWEQVQLAPDGRASVRRSLGQSPYRWVYRNEQTTFASGTFWPSATGEPSPLAIHVGAGQTRIQPPLLRPRAEADGQRRVWVVILDCGDWRLTSYLRQRGEMPNLQALLSEGWRAGLLQDPAFTAAAMEALTKPSLTQSASFLASVNELGIELGGLSSIGKNPFTHLGFFLPTSSDLFATLGAGTTRVGNMLFAHGNVKAGRNAMVTGPNGATTTLEVGAARRERTPEEAAAFPEYGPGVALNAGVEDPLSGTAAQLDAVVRLIQTNAVDVLLYRLESLDLMTHSNYAAIASTAQDDGRGELFSFYRYIDYRLAEVAKAVDGDDMLIVMSDHGIKTSMEHFPVAMFVAWGNGVPAGRTTGYPVLRGVARTIADLRGVETPWPDSGIAPWASGWAGGRTPAGIGVPYSSESPK